MEQLEYFYTVTLIVQILHSLEELSTGFHKKWYLFHMPFWVFLLFEILFTALWISVLLFQAFPYREIFQASFMVLMFANGIQHLIWARIEKKYVPGLILAPMHVVIFLLYYFKI
ncbi:MAG: HXXEE domain-containing protein [Weeksellaceae bacterium]